MKYSYLRLFLTALTVSTTVLFGGEPVWRAFVPDVRTNQIFPVERPVGQDQFSEGSFTGIPYPAAVVITPDGTRAVVSNLFSDQNNFSLLDVTAAPSLLLQETVALGYYGNALSPDGTKIYCTLISGDNGDLFVLRTSDLSSIADVTGFGSEVPFSIALSPNKAEGYVLCGTGISIDNLYVLNTDTNLVNPTPIPVSSINPTTGFLAVTPDGEELYIGSSNFSYFTLSDFLPHASTGVPSSLSTGSIAIAPDGSAIYAIQTIGTATSFFLTKVDIKTHAYVTSYPISGTLISPFFVLITPDGKRACVSDTDSGWVCFIDLTDGTTTLEDLSGSEGGLFYSAITPDQAPTALFSYAASGSTVTFDASGSSSPVGSIASYDWDFGDGQTETTASPTVSHTYSTGGAMTVTLTVINTAGTSTDVTFTGRMVSNNGGLSAKTSQQISVGAESIAHFNGKIHRHHKPYMSTWWSKSTFPHTKKYRIFAHDRKIATIKAPHEKQKTIRLHPKHHRVGSKKYRHYLENKYNIRAEDSSGQVSQPTFVRVKKS